MIMRPGKPLLLPASPLFIWVSLLLALMLNMLLNMGGLGRAAWAPDLLALASIHRRLLWFPVMVQAVHVLPIFMVAQILVTVVRLMAGGQLPGWSVALAPVLTAALWPVAGMVLLAPQRRAHDPDDNRPL